MKPSLLRNFNENYKNINAAIMNMMSNRQYNFLVNI